MTLRDVSWDEAAGRLSASLASGGAFLVAAGPQGRANPMTIGWAQVGVVWSRPILTVLVRRSRYTYECLADADSFTVNLPAPGTLGKELAICGTKSGRDIDKVETCGLATAPGRVVETPILRDCRLWVECRVAARSQLERFSFDSAEILDRYYGADDHHLIVFGEILACYEEATE